MSTKNSVFNHAFICATIWRVCTPEWTGTGVNTINVYAHVVVDSGEIRDIFDFEE